MDAREFSELMMAALGPDAGEEEVAEFRDCLASMRDFRRAELLTSNEGFVVILQDGTEFQVSVVRSR